MSEASEVPSARGKMRASARAVREAKAAQRQVLFDAMAAGWSIEEIAALRKVSPRTVRREVDRALDERRLDAPDRYAKLQVARLNRALRLAGDGVEGGDLKAIGPLVKVVRALDRYHGLAALASAQLPAPAAPSLPAPPLPAPLAPLQLTRAAPPPVEAAPAAEREDLAIAGRAR